MKIIDKIRRTEDDNRPFWSFEYFPPKTTAGVQNLFERMERMYNLGPEFVDITWNAGGTSSDLTSELVATAQSVYGLETCMHLTCTNMPKEKIDIALKVKIPSKIVFSERSVSVCEGVHCSLWNDIILCPIALNTN